MDENELAGAFLRAILRLGVDMLEALFWLIIVVSATVTISLVIKRRRAQKRRAASLTHGVPLAGHPADCPCRDDRTIHMWTIPSNYEGSAK